jgi:hypothetical protein
MTTPLGSIIRVQVQRSSHKLPAAADAAHPQAYSPAPLLPVAALRLTPEGVFGLADGVPEPIVDVHHRQHPESRYAIENPLSVGFTAHYAAMRQYFGAHLEHGIAGENVLVHTEDPVEPEQAARGFLVQVRGGALVALEPVRVAEPCVPFTRFALRLAPAEHAADAVREGLQFLRSGRRGYYTRYAGEPVELHPGDLVFARD